MDYFNQESKRLLFQKLDKTHIPRWISFFNNNNSLTYLGLDLTKSHSFLAKDWITAQFDRYKTHNLGHLAVAIKSTNEFIGLAGVIPRELNGTLEYEIAYSLIPQYWGLGYGTEAAQQLLHYASNNIIADRFISIIHVDNTASIQVAIKNGMKILFQTEYMNMPVNVFGIYQ